MTIKADDLPALYREVFEEDRRGAAILEDLQRRFGGVQVHTTGGVDAVLKTFHSASQAAVIGHIFRMINKANSPDDADPGISDDPAEN